MHVYIDDSGDGGMKFGKGSTRFLVMAACVFDDTRQIELLDQKVSDLSQQLHRKPEFKFHKTKKTHKRMFFEAIEPVNFAVRVLVIDKTVLYSETLRKSPSKLKSFAISLLLTHTFDTVKNAKILIDGQDTKSFGITDASYIMKKANGSGKTVVRKVEFVDSRNSVGIQLADMIAGAIRQYAESGEKSTELYDTFKTRTFQPEGSYWVFK